MTNLDPLDGLLQEALAEQFVRKDNTKQRAVHIKGSPRDGRHDKPLRADPRFANPENWNKGPAVALMHLESMTLLGNFQEFIHKSFTATKLVRLTEPMACEETRWVRGEGWLTPEEEKHAEPERWVETREIRCGITLAQVGLHCPDAEVMVRLEFGGIARVELKELTRFTCPARDTFMLLPKGLDVIEAMSLDSKLVLRSELELDKEEEDE